MTLSNGQHEEKKDYTYNHGDMVTPNPSMMPSYQPMVVNQPPSYPGQQEPV